MRRRGAGDSSPMSDSPWSQPGTVAGITQTISPRHDPIGIHGVVLTNSVMSNDDPGRRRLRSPARYRQGGGNLRVVPQQRHVGPHALAARHRAHAVEQEGRHRAAADAARLGLRQRRMERAIVELRAISSAIGMGFAMSTPVPRPSERWSRTADASSVMES